MLQRRQVLAGGISLFAYSISGVEHLLTPAQAKAQGAAFKVLSPGQVATLEVFCEFCVPGARAAGIAHYIDAQLNAEPDKAMLMLRYLDIAPPFKNFYAQALKQIAAYRSFDIADFLKLQPNEGELPPPLIYFVLRSDAVDVVYGTREGMMRLGVPVMAHLEPEAEWE